MSLKFNVSTITTKEYKKTKDFEIIYGFTESKFGHCIIGTNKENLLCYVGFFDEGNVNSAIDNLKEAWPNAVLTEDNDAIRNIAAEVFDKENASKELNVLFKGTDLQVSVWKELTKLKAGSTVSYGQIAQAVGKPSAVRSVATAVAKNKIAYLVPCHRVIQKSGRIGKYRWGVERKKSMLEYEKN